MDEETTHLHLVFIPVVHTQDKNGNNIDKIACSEFWRAKDSYKDFNKLMLGRDEKIQKEIIEPKDKIIDKLYSDNKKLHCELEKQIEYETEEKEMEL